MLPLKITVRCIDSRLSPLGRSLLKRETLFFFGEVRRRTKLHHCTEVQGLYRLARKHWTKTNFSAEKLKFRRIKSQITDLKLISVKFDTCMQVLKTEFCKVINFRLKILALLES